MEKDLSRKGKYNSLKSNTNKINTDTLVQQTSLPKRTSKGKQQLKQPDHNTIMQITTTLLLTVSLLGCIDVSARSQFTMPPEIPTTLPMPVPQPEKPDTTQSNRPKPAKKKQPIQLSIKSSKASYKLGELMSLKIKTNKDCYLTIIDFGTSGAANILYPNAHQKNNKLKANKTLATPNSKFDIEIGGKTGTETLWARCSQTSKPLLNNTYNFKKHVFIPLGKASSIETIPEKAINYSPHYDPQTEARKTLKIKIRQ